MDSDGKHNAHDKDNKSDNRGVWGSLTDQMKRHGGIKIAIKKQSEKLERIRQEILESSKQKQEVVLTHCHLTIALSNIIKYKISLWKD